MFFYQKGSLAYVKCGVFQKAYCMPCMHTSCKMCVFYILQRCGNMIWILCYKAYHNGQCLQLIGVLPTK